MTVVIYFIIYAFLGWVTEVVYAYAKHKRFINRGFLYGPLCPIYGVGIIVVVSLVQIIIPPSKSFEWTRFIGLFMVTLFVTTLIEWIVGALMFKFFHTRWWDYSNRKWNINGYICMRFSLLWGFFGAMLIQWFHPIIVGIVQSVQIQVRELFVVFFLVYFMTDLAYTLRNLIDFHRALLELERVSDQYAVSKSRVVAMIQERKEMLTEKIREEVFQRFETERWMPRIELKEFINEIKLGLQRPGIMDKFDVEYFHEQYDKLLNNMQRNHLYKAFPDMTSKRFKEALNDLKQKSKESHNR